MNQYYVWPDYDTLTLNVAKVVYENQSYYVARRNGEDWLLCIQRKYLPHAVDSAQLPYKTTNILGWEGGWQLHRDACVVKGQKELEACRKEWGEKLRKVAFERDASRIRAVKAQIAELDLQLHEQRRLLQSTYSLLSQQFGREGIEDEDAAKEQPHE